MTSEIFRVVGLPDLRRLRRCCGVTATCAVSMIIPLIAGRWACPVCPDVTARFVNGAVQGKPERGDIRPPISGIGVHRSPVLGAHAPLSSGVSQDDALTHAGIRRCEQPRPATAVLRIGVFGGLPTASVFAHLHGSASLRQDDGYASDVTAPGRRRRAISTRIARVRGHSGITTTACTTRRRTPIPGSPRNITCTIQWNARSSRRASTTSRSPCRT